MAESDRRAREEVHGAGQEKPTPAKRDEAPRSRGGGTTPKRLPVENWNGN